MNQADRVRLEHMLEMALKAQIIALNRTRRELDTDDVLQLALARAIEIIGEAGSKVSQDIQLKQPQIPWAEITAMRNRLIHAYFDINLDVLWTTVTDDLPPLIADLEKILATGKPSSNSI